MKSVLISIRPRWAEKICHKIGNDTNRNPIYEKPIEVRRSKPSEVPFRGLIYATKPKEWYKCGAVRVSDESLWLASGKVEMCDGLKFWGDCVENYQCLNGKVIGEFICNTVEEFHEWELSPQGKFADFERERLAEFLTASCLSEEEVVRYRENLPYYQPLYGWHISDLKIYDKPKELSEFYRICKNPCKPSNGKTLCLTTKLLKMNGCDGKIPLTRPPQSYMFVEEV